MSSPYYSHMGNDYSTDNSALSAYLRLVCHLPNQLCVKRCGGTWHALCSALLTTSQSQSLYVTTQRSAWQWRAAASPVILIVVGNGVEKQRSECFQLELKNCDALLWAGAADGMKYSQFAALCRCTVCLLGKSGPVYGRNIYLGLTSLFLSYYPEITVSRLLIIHYSLFITVETSKVTIDLFFF